MKEFFKISAMCILAAITYGIIHDQITVRICVEYFTIGHVSVGTESPTLLGLIWGVIATWWFGLFLGIPLGLAARIGSLPKFTAYDLRAPVVYLMSGCFILAFCVGLIGYLLAQQKMVGLTPSLIAIIPPQNHSRFLATLWIHNTSYLSGFIGALILYVWVIAQRVRRLQNSRYSLQ